MTERTIAETIGAQPGRSGRESGGYGSAATFWSNEVEGHEVRGLWMICPICGARQLVEFGSDSRKTRACPSCGHLCNEGEYL